MNFFYFLFSLFFKFLMSKAPQAPIQVTKVKKVDKHAKWINSLSNDDPQSLILSIFEENDRLRREIDTLKKINFALKKDIDDLHAKLIHERYENLYPSTGGQDMETE